MSASLSLVVLMAVMYAAGVYVVLERSLTRVLIGFLLIGNATNLLILIMSGRAGQPAFMADGADPGEFTDPLPQALILTAIVINFGVSAFLLALIYRSWWLAQLGDRADAVVTEHEDDVIAAERVFATTSEDEEAVLEALGASDEAAVRAAAPTKADPNAPEDVVDDGLETRHDDAEEGRRD